MLWQHLKLEMQFFLHDLSAFLAYNTGSFVSPKKISDYFKSQRIRISTQVVIDYLGYLESSFLISKVEALASKGGIFKNG